MPLTIRTPTQVRLSVEKRRSTRRSRSPNDNDAWVRVRKIASGRSPPIQTLAAQRWIASPKRPSGCTLAAAAWLIQASETSKTMLIKNIIMRSACRARTCVKPSATNAKAKAIKPRRSCQTRPKFVSNKTICQAVVNKARIGGNPLMFATSSQNQSRPDRKAATRLHRTMRNKHSFRSWKSSLPAAGPMVISLNINVPASRIVAPMCVARAMMSSAMSIKFLYARVPNELRGT